MAGKGLPKKFKNGQELIKLWTEFCDSIRENDYNAAPTQTAFCRWLAENYNSVDRKTIYSTLNDYFPNIKKDFDAIRADVITEGTMLGKYQPTMSIFALKNWCSWTDTPNETTVIIDDTTRNEVVTLVDNIRKQHNKK